MKKLFGTFTVLGLVTIALLVLCAGLAFAGVIHPAACALPLIGIGAVKVRDGLDSIRTIKYTHSSATTVDTIYYLNGRVLLALNTALANIENVFVISGLIEYTKVSAQAWTGGQKIWWDDGNSRFTNVYGADCYLAGYAAEAAANPTTTGFVVLDPGQAEPIDQIPLAEGSILVGSSGGVASAVVAKTSGRILVGDGTTTNLVAVSGDATLSSAGALTIGAGAVTAAKLAQGPGFAALLASGLGASAAYIKTTNGAQTLMASDAAARVALVIVHVDEAFADAGGNQPVVIIGETDTTNKYAANTLLVGASVGDVFVLAGTLTANKALLVTCTQAVGAGTGGITVTAIVLPAAV